MDVDTPLDEYFFGCFFDDVGETSGTRDAFVLMYSWSIGNTIGELAVVDEIFLDDKGGDLDDIFLTLTYS